MQEPIIDVGGVHLWTCCSGSGLPIMLSSGGPGWYDYLEPVAAMMDDLARVHRWEQRGCGRSDRRGPYDLDTSIADLDALRVALADKKFNSKRAGIEGFGGEGLPILPHRRRFTV